MESNILMDSEAIVTIEEESVEETLALTVDKTTGEIAVAGDTEATTGALTTETAAEENGFSFQPGRFVENIRYMGLGMLGIFIVIGIIMAVTVILNKAFKK